MYKGIELRGDNPLKAVVEGTPYNVHLVAGNAFAWGVAHAAEQYHITEKEVFTAIRFYLAHQEDIEARYDKASENAPSKEEQLERKRDAYLAAVEENKNEAS